jgi:hypothetical protein
MKEFKEPQVGDVVIWTDSLGKDHNALVQTRWTGSTINVCFLSSDESRTDSYGRQIEHATSCIHVSKADVYGFYWRWPGEEKNEYKKPEQK